MVRAVLNNAEIVQNSNPQTFQLFTMTLVISCLTRHQVIQVSDQRLVFPDGTLSDHHNKALLYKHTISFSYSGMAYLDGKETHLWLRDRLQDDVPHETLLDKLKHVATAAENAMGQIGIPDEMKRHSFVGAGWVRGFPASEQLDLLSGEIIRRNEHLEEMVKELPEVEHLREIPGVGPVVATYFVLTIDDPHRFRNSRDVALFFGLRPSMRESASVTHFGRITKEGDPEMRRLLVQAAHACLLTKADSELKSWTLALAERKGKGKAVVALARKLAVLMHHLWVTGEVYQASPNKATIQAA